MYQILSTLTVLMKLNNLAEVFDFQIISAICMYTGIRERKFNLHVDSLCFSSYFICLCDMLYLVY